MTFYYNAKKQGAKKMRKEKKHYVYKKKSINILLSLVVLSGLFVYLVQSNSLLTRGYELEDVQKKIDDLERVGKDLENKSLQLQSMSVLAPKIEKLKLVENYYAKFNETIEKSVVKR